MTQSGIESLFRGFSDPRSGQGRRYRLESLLGLLLVGLLCGRNTVKGIWRLGHQLGHCERRALGFDRNRLPSHPLLTTLLQRLDAVALEARLRQIMLSSEDGKVKALAIDGKTLRGSRDGARPAMHLLEAFSAELGGVLHQEPMHKGENEVGAAMRLLERLSLRDTVVTGDAMFAHQDLCREIRKRGGHYLFALKDNHKPQRQAVERALEGRAGKKNAAARRRS